MAISILTWIKHLPHGPAPWLTWRAFWERHYGVYGIRTAPARPRLLHEEVPAWRIALIPPFWFRLALCVGPWRAFQFLRDRRHPVHQHLLASHEYDARVAYFGWFKGLTNAQRARLHWGLPTVKPTPPPPDRRPTAQIIRLDKFLEFQRLLRAREAERHPRRVAGFVFRRDPKFSPAFEERLRQLEGRLNWPEF